MLYPHYDVSPLHYRALTRPSGGGYHACYLNHLDSNSQMRLRAHRGEHRVDMCADLHVSLNHLILCLKHLKDDHGHLDANELCQGSHLDILQKVGAQRLSVGNQVRSEQLEHRHHHSWCRFQPFHPRLDFACFGEY